MASQAAIISETDDDSDLGQGAAAPAPAIEIPGDSGLAPVRTPPIRDGRQTQAPQEVFEAFEVDGDEGYDAVISQPQRTAEGGLSEQDAGEQTFLDRQAQEQRGVGRHEIKSARAARRAAAKERDQAELRRTQRELAELRGKFSEFAQRVDPRIAELGEVNINRQRQDLDAAIASNDRAFELAENAYFDAMEAGDKAVARAKLRERDDFAFRKYQLQGQKTQFDALIEGRRAQGDTGGNGQQQQQTTTRRDPAVTQQDETVPQLNASGRGLVDDFYKRHNWINQKRPDMESKIVFQIDTELMEEGFDPNSAEYYDELEDRAAKYLPHRFPDADPEPQPVQQQRQARAAAPAPRAVAQAPAPVVRRGPPMMGPSDGGQQAPAKNQVRITPQRKQAMIEAGVLNADASVNDLPRYTRMLKRYHDFDLENAGR